jgi:putative ABC transport system permease protein
MSSNKHHTEQPPRWATGLLEWYCKRDLFEDLSGDLHEYFVRNVETKGIKKARLIYIIDVFKFFRPYTIRKPKFLNILIQWIMIGSYVKTSGRNILRNKLFSTINIAGLAVSMSVGLLLIGLLSDMTSYDRFHEKGNRIYRVVSQYQYLDHIDNSFYASSSPMVGKEVKENMPGVEATALLYNGFGGDIKAADKTIPLDGLYSNEAFFDVFSFKLLEGNASTALKAPFSMVITEATAKKLFGSESALSKVVTQGDEEFTITGVVKDPPKFSHIKFDMLVSLCTREVTEKDRWDKEEMKWDNIWSGYTYMLLTKDADLDNIQRNLNIFAEKNDNVVPNTKVRLATQPMFDIAMGEDMNNSLGNIMGKGSVIVIGVLAIIVILSACFNYTNLSIARATRRTREVGIRKCIGALRGHVLGQFLVEAVMVSLLSLGLAFVLFLVLKPYFLALEPRLQDMLNLELSLSIVLYFIALALVVGLFAGIVPALLFSKLNAIQVLKDNSSVKLFRHLNMRRALIVLQYTISLVFITATVIGYKQYKFYLNFDLGYKTENILNIKLEGNKADIVRKELQELPEVEKISKSMMITSVGNYWGTRMKYKDPMDSTMVYYNGVDENYVPLHEIKLLAGRNFTALPDSAIESEVIVNEETLKRFKIGEADPVKALDEIILVDRKPMKIVGVMKDFHYGKADNNEQEVVLRYMPAEANFVNVKIATTDWLTTLAKVDDAWRKIDNVHPLEAQLYSDRIQHSYREMSAMLSMIGFLAFLAICISSLGMLGMVIFMTETRLKEISIRKVLGASESKLIYILGRGFILLLAIAGCIALPLTYIFFEQIAFHEMGNHTPILVTDIFVGFVVVVAIAFLMIGSQTIKIARTNPAEVLKNE